MNFWPDRREQFLYRLGERKTSQRVLLRDEIRVRDSCSEGKIHK